MPVKVTIWTASSLRLEIVEVKHYTIYLLWVLQFCSDSKATVLAQKIKPFSFILWRFSRLGSFFLCLASSVTTASPLSGNPLKTWNLSHASFPYLLYLQCRESFCVENFLWKISGMSATAISLMSFMILALAGSKGLSTSICKNTLSSLNKGMLQTHTIKVI